MCRFSSSCRRDCQTSSACPAVSSAWDVEEVRKSWPGKFGAEYHRNWAKEHPAQKKAEQKRRLDRIHKMKVEDPKKYRALLDRKNANKRARRAKCLKK